jgi:uracil-DNA glycosylase
VPAFGDPKARLLIAGLAPGLQGANRTGRPFTGDYAGELLYSTLLAYGFSEGVYKAGPEDGLALRDAIIVNAVRCVPPENKPTPIEIRTCNSFLNVQFENLSSLKVR